MSISPRPSETDATRTTAERSADVSALEAARQHLSATAAAFAAIDAALKEAETLRVRGLAELQAAIRQQEAFLASISHDLRTPLTVIKGEAQLLQRRARRVGAVEPERILRGLERIDASVGKTAALIDERLAALRRQIADLTDDVGVPPEG